MRFSLLLISSLILTCTANADDGFKRACERSDQTITIAALGDVLLHGQLQSQAYSSPRKHASLWRDVSDLISGADIAYANLEGPVAEGVNKSGRNVRDPGMVYDNSVYSGYPLFNYHSSLISALKDLGIDVVSTANNHAMDRGSLGANKTIEALQSEGLLFTGTKTHLDDKSKNWHTITRKNGFNIAWIACSFSTNGMPDSYHQVLGCFKDEVTIKSEISKLNSNPNIDAVIITPHWGEAEYSHKIEASQKALAKRFFEAGALAIIGNHPHVTKPWEKYTTSDGRETFVIYSIGNFVSAQGALAKKTSPIVYLGLSKNNGQKAWINGFVYVPTYVFSHPYEVVASDRSSRVPSESTKLLKQLLGSERLVSSNEKIITNFECR